MNRRTLRAVRLGLAVSAFGLGLAGCSDRSASAPPAADADKVVRDDVYEDVLGVITNLPVAGQPGTELKIHHEHIPGFKTKEGSVNVTADGVPGMKSMIMPFPAGEGVDLSGFAVGDTVKFTFVVHWGGSPAWEVTRIEKMPEGTEVDFANKVTEMPAADDAHDDHAGHDHSGHDHGSP
jgi:hypothetical protein